MDEKMLEYEANFSVLDRYGTDITKEQYITNPAIGRDEQIRQLILILLTPEKSAILIGKPGIGKTAIVEGLAYRIQQNDVPEALKGYSIVNIKTASLLGTMPSGESKVQKMIDELKTKEKLILFVDEIHMLIGATDESSLDFANIFKEGLGRGSIKVIGATTTEEYERYILRDKAFTRRFQKVEVPEPSRDETVKIMMGTLPKFEKQTGRKMKYTPFIQERIMGFLVDITSEYKRVYALGSRYPDVCLTLLKQAFSYTVYDDRPYMDIFDVRKAVENTKNVYPDVIKKELPNFDEMFKDIIAEEKGEKPIEEWRLDQAPTRAEMENGPTPEENLKQFEENLDKLEKEPQIIDRRSDRDNPIKNIISDKKGAQVGSTSISSGLNEKIDRGKDAKQLDDILLSGELEVIKAGEMNKPQMPTSYKITEEIKPGVSDAILLGKPIQSTIDDGLNEFQEVGVYTKKNGKKGGKKMNGDRQRPVRQDISTQNFDKYSNYFSQTDEPTGIDSKNPVNDFLPKNNNNGQFNNPPGGMNPNQPPQFQGNGMGQRPMGGYPQGGMNQQMPPQFQGNGMGQRPMGPQQGPMGGYPQGGMNQQMPPQFQGNGMGQRPMGPPQQNDNLFGAPMYGNNGGNNNYDNIPDIYGQGPMGPPKGSRNTFLDNPEQQQEQGYSGESLFGAPMYSEDQTSSNNQNQNNGTEEGEVDIFGQLITDNMRIKNGKIVDEFPTFDKLNNLSNIKTVISDVRDGSEGNNMMPPQQGQMFQNNGPMGGYQNNGMMNGMMNQPMPQQQGFLPPMNDFNQMPPQQQAQPQSKNWTFIDDGDLNQMNPMGQMPAQDNYHSGFQDDILEAAKQKEENNIAPSANSAMPTSNKDYYEDMKSGDFVNLNDLNNGKIKEEDSNKYMGVSITDNKPQFDLNIEGDDSSDGDNAFDDFYE